MIVASGLKLNAASSKLNNNGHQSTAKQVYQQLESMGLLDGNAPREWAPKAPKRSTFYASSTGAAKTQRKKQRDK